MTGGGAAFQLGDRVRVQLTSSYWRTTGWLEGTIVRIDPYSSHRRFYWVELDVAAIPLHGGATDLVAILNPRHISRL